MPPLSFSLDSDQKLIKLIKDNPVLYNLKHPKYSNCDVRELTWQKIGDVLGRPTAEFAGIQCHIQYGEYQQEKHKLGFIENLSEYLPAQYTSSWGIEKKILKEYSKHVELNELEAKHLYTKTARELPTYGVTFFLVKEKQKGRKKLVPRLLGINSNAILRLDETTKEILQQWPLTHVKTYFVGKGETFTLDFGDYSEKDYSVKTRHALRIRDILEGYIDLIRKRMLANYNQSQTEYGSISQDNVSTGQAGMLQLVSNSPMQVVEQSCVGPSRILQYEPGQKATEGTQVCTVQQILTSELIKKLSQGVKSEVPVRTDLSVPFTKRLNRMNSNSVKVVTLLTEPSQAKIEDAQKIVDEMNTDMPFIRDGVKETVATRATEEEKRKLLDQLNSLEELMKTLSQSSKSGSVDTSEADDAAKQIADLTTQMYFAMDPNSRRRSRILSKSRNSFIADENTERNLRRASFIAATATANHALDNAEELLTENYSGPGLDAKGVAELERSAVDKIGKINAAIAHYVLAHSDPQNIDYGAAINSLNTIHELVPELSKDGRALGSVQDGQCRQALLADIKELCAAAKHVCALSGVEDAEKLQEASAKYADVAGRLVFIFGRGSKPRVDKENEVIKLARAAGEQTSLLLASTKALAPHCAAMPAATMDAASARTAAAARDLLAQAELNAPTISEPHCQSALTAASEALSASAQTLAMIWRPLVESPALHENGEMLHNRTMDLAKALDRLRDSYAHLGGVQDATDAPKISNEAQRLEFIKSVSRVGGNMQAVEDDLKKPVTSQVKATEAEEAELRLAKRLAQLNAAVASLLAATSDHEHPDYATAELAVQTINELMPEVVKDSKTATANLGEASRAALLDNIRALCAASNTICASSYGVTPPEELSDAVTKYTDTAGKLTYVVNKRANPNKESEIIAEATAASSQAGLLLGGVQQLVAAAGGAGGAGGARGAALDARGAALADAAQSLITTAQLTAASISDPRCQSALLSSIDKVASSGKQLADSWAPLAKEPKQEMRVQALKGALKQLSARLERLRAACNVPEEEVQNIQSSELVQSQDAQEPMEQQKLQFIMTMKGAKGRLIKAQNELDKPTVTAKGADVEKVQDRLSLGLGQLNAAIATLLTATADSDSTDYEAAEKAANTIAELMPQVILDTKTVSACKEEPARAAMLAQIKELCEASEGICASSYGSNPEGLNDAVSRFTDASGKLVYVVSPRVNPVREEQIVSLSSGACGQTSALLTKVAQLAAAVGGDKGQELDDKGGAMADAANSMLQTAQITAPSMASMDCQDTFLSSVDNLSGAGQQLAASLTPLNTDPKHKQQSQALNEALQQLEAQLKVLRKTCKASEGDLQDPSQQQKLQFIKSMQGAKGRLGDAHKELNKPTKPVKGAGVEEVQQRLSDRMGRLNAAIAALLAATADRQNPDYLTAEKAATTVADLMPHIVQDTKTVSACKEEPARAAMLAQIKELCEASEGICASSYGSNPEGLNDAVSRFTNASGKLVYVVSPRVNPVTKEQIIGLSTGAGGLTSQLLSGVARLAAAAGGDRGRELDHSGGAVADAAQAMIQAAQITAPSMSSPHCQEALLLSVDNLSGAGHQLAASLAPLNTDPSHKQQSQALKEALQQLEAQLEALRQACKGTDDGQSQDPDKQQKLQFIKTMEAAKRRMGDSQKELDKPTKPTKGSDVETVQLRLSQRLGQLNAAIASLLAATADREKPDCAAAEKAAKTIADLMPHVIQDTKTVSACKEEPARAAMLAQIKELCEASEGICASSYGSSTQDLNNAVAKFTDASGKLVYVVSPRANAQREEQIVNISTGAGGQTTQLLSSVAQLAAAVGGAKGQELDERGGAVAEATQVMVQAAQITAPSMSSSHCQEVLLSSVDKLSNAGQLLSASLAPLNTNPKHKQQSQAVKEALQQLEAQLKALRKTCKAPEVGQSQVLDQQQKLQFIKSMKSAKARVEEAQKELDKPIKPAKGSDMETVQLRLSQRLGQLNAAIASLLAATADRDKPDCAAAEKAAKVIGELMPHVIQDTKTVSACKEEPARAAMLTQVKELCEATEGICASSYGSTSQGLNSEIAKFTDASGKLVYVVTPTANAKREDQIVNISTGAGGLTSQLLSGVARLAAAAGGDRGRELDHSGGAVADAAQAMLQTAQITAPSMSSPHCQEALLSSVDKLSSAGQQLAASLTPLNTDPKHKQQSQALKEALQQLEAQLEALRQACKTADALDSQGPLQKQKLQFIKTVQESKGRWADAQKELNKPMTAAKGQDVEKTQQRLSQRLGELNAAIAALLSATADREKPQYAEAENSVKIITDLLPQLVQDTKTISACKEEPARAAMLAQIEELCEASEGICAGAAGSNPVGLNNAVVKFTDASGKLVYVVCPRIDPQKENQIIGLSTGAGGLTSQLLSGVARLAAAAGGDRGRELDHSGGAVADAAQAMIQAAQITAPSMSSPHCQAALISSVEQLSSSAHQLSTSLAPLLEDPKHSQQARKLHQALQQLQAQLDALKKASTASDTAPPSVASKPTAGPDGSQYTVAHAVPNRTSADVTQDFLQRMRQDEVIAQNPPSSPKPITTTGAAVVGKVEKAKPPPPPVRKTPDDEKQRQQFVALVDNAQRNIKENKASLVKLSNQETSSGPALSQSDMMKKQVSLQQNLALAAVEVTQLVAARYEDKIDYAAASKSAQTLPLFVTSIVEDGKQLCDNVNDMARKAFLYDLLQLCDSATSICDAAKTDRPKLNEAAVEFGDRSTKLLYVVSNDVDAALEKEIISRTKAIGDSAFRLAKDADGVATAASGNASREICNAGTACVDAAVKLVYTAKLMAPSIYETPCQNALVSSTETLSTKLKSFSDSWKLLSSDPQQVKTIKELTREAENLERILEGLRGDVKGGRIGKRREMEQLVVEDTPMRQLTVKILDDAKVYAEASDLPASQKIEYAAYADKLNNALRALDLAHARCKKMPHDTNKRRELENAIQNLQMILLQSRPNRGDKGKTNIVDLRDFIEEVSSEAKNLSATASGVNVPTAQDKRKLEDIKEKCVTIEKKAYNLMNVDSRTDLDSTFNDILEVDQFGQECDDIIKNINKDLKEMEDVKAKRLILSQILPLSESCNMLRFATKSGISTEASATLDASLDDLDDIEARVITSIVPEVAEGVVLRSKQPRAVSNSTAAINLCREVASSSAGVAPSTVTAYIAEAVAKTDTANPEEKNRLLKHLYKLVHLLKTLTVTTSRRAATWQDVSAPEVATVTEQILKEIHNPESKFGAKADETKNKILDENDIAKLLIPSAPKFLGDQKQQEDKLVQLASKLSSMCAQVPLGAASPAALARSAHAAAAAAGDLHAVARGCKTQNRMQSKKVDEAAKEMSFATYNVLKSAENACQDPNNPSLRNKLVEACERLNLCIDKLVSSSSSAPALQQQCGAMQRSAALQLAAMAPRAPASVPAHRVAAELSEQKEHIYKLKSTQAMPRQEFMRGLDDINAAVRRSTDCAAHCAYYIAVSEQHKDIAKSGLVDVPQIQKYIESIQDSCMIIIGSSNITQAKEEKEDLVRRVQDLSVALDKAHVTVRDGDVKRTLVRAKSVVCDAAAELENDLKEGGDMGKVTPKAVTLLEAVDKAHSMIEQCPLVPRVGDMSPATKASCDEVINHSKSLLSSTMALLKEVQAAPGAGGAELLTWVTYGSSSSRLLDAYDALVRAVQKNGHRAGILEKAPEEEKEEVKKSYIEIQVDLANRWLRSSICKVEAKDIGQQAVRNVVDLARQMSEDLKGSEREEALNIISETEELLSECSKKYDHEKNSVLMDRVKELKKSIQRGVVTRVVEDFIADEDPLADLDVLADTETDEYQRKFILERKIASLLAQLGRVTKTARFVAGASQHLGMELTQCSDQTELLAPMLVKAAQQRIDNPDNTVIVENYKALLAQYAESISKVRDLCDRAVDPMDFVQAAGDTMQRMREDMTQHNNDPQKCAHASSAITRLANRVIHVSMSSNAVQSDPELQTALAAAERRLRAAAPAPGARASRLPHWRDTTAEILNTTAEVESALGGENIFKKQPTTANQHIYNGAVELHKAVAGWSSHGNEIVAVARRTAVLMARLSEYMETDKKEALIATSKSIVMESQEVAELAKKLAHECTDVRIKTNLLQTCERIPTISGQLKMLTTVKGSSLGHQGSAEDKEAMDMLVGNAQSLMISIQEVVKAAAGASVKIMSQRGPRLRWVRKNLY